MQAPFLSSTGLRESLKPINNSAGGVSCSSTHCLLQDGTWAGQHELVAVARMLPAELRIYQAGQPSWTISSGVTSGKAGGPPLAWPTASCKCTRGLEHAASRMRGVSEASAAALKLSGCLQGAPSIPTLHLSYHDGEHYNSIRSSEDYGSGVPMHLSVCARQQGVQQGAGSAVFA